MHYLLQTQLFREFHEEKLISTLEKFNLPHGHCKTKPFSLIYQSNNKTKNHDNYNKSI